MKVGVLGAGALGTAAALHLGRAGHEVTLIEEVQVAGRTTGLAAGLLSLALLDPIDRALTAATMSGLAALEREHPTDGPEQGPLLHRPGSHLLAAPGAETDVVHRLSTGIAAMGLPQTIWSAAEWAEEMAARDVDVSVDGLQTVLSSPYDAWALSTEATSLMARAAKAAGVRLRIGRADRLLDRDGRIDGVVLGDGSEERFDATVVALGAWTRGFLGGHGLRVPARAYRTHAAVMRSDLASRMPILHDHAGHYYLRPEGPNHLLIGNGTRTGPTDPEGFTNDPEPFFVAGLAERLPRRFPQLAHARPQNAWRGVLSGVPDKRPLVGPHPDREGLWLCTGGNGYGFMRSHALGACLAAAVDGQSPTGYPSDILDWMDPARFWPDPPQTFPVLEGFQLLPPARADE